MRAVSFRVPEPTARIRSSPGSMAARAEPTAYSSGTRGFSVWKILPWKGSPMPSILFAACWPAAFQVLWSASR